jgi:hypothetical protein
MTNLSQYVAYVEKEGPIQISLAARVVPSRRVLKASRDRNCGDLSPISIWPAPRRKPFPSLFNSAGHGWSPSSRKLFIYLSRNAGLSSPPKPPNRAQFCEVASGRVMSVEAHSGVITLFRYVHNMLCTRIPHVTCILHVRCLVRIIIHGVASPQKGHFYRHTRPKSHCHHIILASLSLPQCVQNNQNRGAR